MTQSYDINTSYSAPTTNFLFPAYYTRDTLSRCFPGKDVSIERPVTTNPRIMNIQLVQPPESKAAGMEQKGEEMEAEIREEAGRIHRATHMGVASVVAAVKREGLTSPHLNAYATEMAASCETCLKRNSFLWCQITINPVWQVRLGKKCNWT